MQPYCAYVTAVLLHSFCRRTAAPLHPYCSLIAAVLHPYCCSRTAAAVPPSILPSIRPQSAAILPQSCRNPAALQPQSCRPSRWTVPNEPAGPRDRPLLCRPRQAGSLVPSDQPRRRVCPAGHHHRPILRPGASPLHPFATCFLPSFLPRRNRRHIEKPIENRIENHIEASQRPRCCACCCRIASRIATQPCPHSTTVTRRQTTCEIRARSSAALLDRLCRREPVESLSRACREPIESLSKAYREPIESPQLRRAACARAGRRGTQASAAARSAAALLLAARPHHAGLPSVLSRTLSRAETS